MPGRQLLGFRGTGMGAGLIVAEGDGAKRRLSACLAVSPGFQKGRGTLFAGRSHPSSGTSVDNARTASEVRVMNTLRAIADSKVA